MAGSPLSDSYLPPPAQTLSRKNKPHPFLLPLPVSPPDYLSLRLDGMRITGTCFPMPSPFVLMPRLSPELYRPEAEHQAGQGQAQAPAQAQGQAQGQGQTQPTEAPPASKPSEAKPKERRGADRNATSMNNPKANKDTKQATVERIVGEIAFQLDRRILSSIFPDRVRLYGYTVSNIPEKIAQGGNDPVSPLTEDQRRIMTDRYNNVMNRLKPINYNPDIHPAFTEHIVNTYGILRERPDTTGAEGDFYNDFEYLLNVINTTVPPDKQNDCAILLKCLYCLSQNDGKPLFIW